jgi:hypothetical protein
MTMPNKITKTSKNINCLEGVKCPKCGQEDLFKIAANVIVEVSDDGTEDHVGDHEWDEQAFCQCCECHHAGKLADFTIENWGKKPKKAKTSPTLITLYKAVRKAQDKFYMAQSGDSGDEEHDAAMDLHASVDAFDAAYLRLFDAAQDAHSQLLQASRMFQNDKEFQDALNNLGGVLGYY